MKHYRRSRYHISRRRALIVIAIVFIFCMSVLFINEIFSKNPVKSAGAPVADNAAIKYGETPSYDTQHSDDNIDIRESKSPSGIDMDNHFNELGIKGKKVAYLTFDDGPSPKTTPRILDILDKYNVKATFFVIGKLAAANRDLILKEKEDGDSIGDHTFTHNYKYVYESPDNLLREFDECAETIHSILGSDYKIKYVRFPGGSFGKKMEPYRQAVMNAGYTFIDWNSLNGDAEGSNIPPEKLLDRLKQTSNGKNTLVILMHDAPAKQTTVQALPQIIEYLRAEGYIFKTLN